MSRANSWASSIQEREPRISGGRRDIDESILEHGDEEDVEDVDMCRWKVGADKTKG
jgi:hypothetical protein